MKRASMRAGRRCVAASLFLAIAGVAHAEPVAEVARTQAAPVLIESVAFDARGRMIVSAINAGGIFRIGRNGALVPWSRQAPSGAPEFYGLAADRARNALWAVTACNVQPVCKTQTHIPSLVRLNLRSGRIERIYTGHDGSKSFGDVAVGGDGAVFVSDSATGEVLTLAPGAETLTRVVKLEGRPSPQGLVVSDDSAVLVFANYGDGLHRVDLRTGVHTRIAGPEGIDIRGVDGVTRVGNRLILVRNATRPARLIQVTLDPAWTRIVDAAVLTEGPPLDEPTSGVIRDGAFVFVSRSQWSDFGEAGPPTGEIAPATVSRMRIPAF